MHLVELKFLTDAHKVHERTLAKRIRQSLIFWHAQHVHLELKEIYKKRFGTKRYRTLGFRDGRRNFKRVPKEPKKPKVSRLVEQIPVSAQASVPTPESPVPNRDNDGIDISIERDPFPSNLKKVEAAYKLVDLCSRHRESDQLTMFFCKEYTKSKNWNTGNNVRLTEFVKYCYVALEQRHNRYMHGASIAKTQYDGSHGFNQDNGLIEPFSPGSSAELAISAYTFSSISRYKTDNIDARRYDLMQKILGRPFLDTLRGDFPELYGIYFRHVITRAGPRPLPYN